MANLPLFSELNLHSNIAKAIDACGYVNPTPVQAKAIPEILEGKDVLASAQTGTGKTAAFVLPSLHHLCLKKPNKKTRVLILTPTRELATQVKKAASLYGKFLQFNIVSLVGGESYFHQIKDLQRGADIIVATPGRLMDHIEQQRVDLSHVEILILDEADRMLDMGFIDDVQYIAKLIPSHRQTLLFSATVDKKLASVVKHLLKNPVRIDLSEKVSPEDIKQELYKVRSPQEKSKLLKHFLNDENIYKAIIFTATKINADRLADQLRDEGLKAAALHGDLRQNVRNRTIDALRRGKIQFLVATDVAARGIDIPDITHVINYDLPRFCEDYVHRIGRTGRAGKKGIAISFVLPSDTRHLQNIERYIGKRLHLSQSIKITEKPAKQNDQPLEILSLESKRVSNENPSTARNGKDRLNQLIENFFSDDDGEDSAPKAKISYKEKKPKREFEREDKRNFSKREKSYSRKGREDFDRNEFGGQGHGSEGDSKRTGERRPRREGERNRDRDGFGGRTRRAEGDSERFGERRPRREGERSKERGGFGGRTRRAEGDSERFGERRPRREGERSKERGGFGGRTRRAEGDSERFGERRPRHEGERSKESGGFGGRTRRAEGDSEHFGERRPRREGERSKERGGFGGRARRAEGDSERFGERRPRREGERSKERDGFGERGRRTKGGSSERSGFDKGGYQKRSFGSKKKYK